MRVGLVITALLAVASTQLIAQTRVGSHDCTVGPGFACDGSRAEEERGPDPRAWIRILVLWKGGESSGSSTVSLRPTRDTALAREIFRRFTAETRAAQDRERAPFGGINEDGWWSASSTFGYRARGADSLFVLDQAFPIPTRDTAIVVLVDGIHTLTHTPRIVAALRIPNRMPARPRERMWVNGDTTFIVRPRAAGGTVPESILQHPEVKAFLGEPTLPPGVMRGQFSDDYGNTFAISDSLFVQQPHGRFEIVEWNIREQYVVAQNGVTNASDPGLWTRIDWMQLPGMAPYTWGFCLTAYRAPTRDAARATPPPDRNAPRTGCNGYPFSRMRPTP